MERERRVAEEVGGGLRDAGGFGCGYGVTAEEERGCRRGEIFGGGLRYAKLGAAGVGDEGVFGGEACDFWEEVECDADGERDVNKIGGAEGGGEIAGEGFVDYVAPEGLLCGFAPITSAEVQVGRV